jgi:hypothetical protein
MKMINVIGFLTFFLMEINDTLSLEITYLSIPSYVPEDHNLSFHCSYNVNRYKLAELDIKWYLGGSPSPFMVFLPHLQKKPQVVDTRFREKIVFNEEVAGSGFIMVNVTTDMSGVYTCKVSTNTEERIRRKRVTVYSKYIYTPNAGLIQKPKTSF